MSVPILPLASLQRHVFLLNSRLGLFNVTLSRSTGKPLHASRAPLLPKLRGHFAEFLNESYFERLSIFYSSTCVGLRYGHLNNWPQKLF